LRQAVEGLRKHLGPLTIVVATARKDFPSFEQAFGATVTLVDEDELIPQMTLAQIKALPLPHFPKAAGWYFQQLLKYAWSLQETGNRSFLIWDADTILLRPLSFSDAEGRVIMTQATEYHAPYFETFERLLGFPAHYEFSFISQHQMIDKSRLQEMLQSIEARFPSSPNWAWAILQALPAQGPNLFSEYETYGHWMKRFHPEELVYRNLPWFRDGTEVAGFPPKPRELEKFSRDYFFVAFEARERRLKKVGALLKRWLLPR